MKKQIQKNAMGVSFVRIVMKSLVSYAQAKLQTKDSGGVYPLQYQLPLLWVGKF